MRVLAKPELDNSIILNEFVMIMENFGVVDSPDGDDSDDYIPDTEQSISQSQTDLNTQQNLDDDTADADKKLESSSKEATENKKEEGTKNDEKDKAAQDAKKAREDGEESEQKKQQV